MLVFSSALLCCLISFASCCLTLWSLNQIIISAVSWWLEHLTPLKAKEQCKYTKKRNRHQFVPKNKDAESAAMSAPMSAPGSLLFRFSYRKEQLALTENEL